MGNKLENFCTKVMVNKIFAEGYVICIAQLFCSFAPPEKPHHVIFLVQVAAFSSHYNGSAFMQSREKSTEGF